MYFLRSLVSNEIYVGATGKRVDKRLGEHNIGSNDWTRANKPFKVVYYESFVCKTDALIREKFFKSGVGRKLKNLIVNNFGD